MDVTPSEARVLGSLIEKQLATPQYYPLTVNALVAACNQTSNRDPVVNYSEGDVLTAVAGLREKGLVRVVHSPGQRADKYRHGLEEVFGIDDQHRAVLGVLLLRGPQTLGELRSRTERLAAFDSTAEVEDVLGLLAQREEPLAARLERAPGQKEARWTQLLCASTGALGALDVGADGSWRGSSPGSMPGASADSLADSLAGEVVALRDEVAALRDEVAALRDELRALVD